MTPKVYLDTNVFIEAFERAGSESSPIWSVLNAIETRELQAVTSELTFAELLPRLISDGETELIALYGRLFSAQTTINTVPVTRDVLLEAAHFRALRLSLKLPDAIHLATAAVSECTAVLSNDQRLGSVGDIPLVPVGPDSLSKIRNVGP